MATTTLESLIGCVVRDAAGAEIGRVENFYVDDESGDPTWASVSTGAGGGRSLMPLTGAQYRAEDNSLSVRVDRDQVRTAPHLEHDGHLDPQAEQQLLAYYSSGQRTHSEAMGDRRIQQAADAPMTYGHGESEGLLISEERLVAGTVRKERIETERLENRGNHEGA
ncbi:PRC-barrel domain-containing protein [Nocardia sp. NBC_00511]|uniref:PRC-barrel domain-containing protein n=1 Tax=Nocardia sp. NBC_00511 TaxID=2903591 RepID=UPI0030E4CDBA